jgi:hypothetical protein
LIESDRKQKSLLLLGLVILQRNMNLLMFAMHRGPKFEKVALQRNANGNAESA